jgi:hypothetical protein
MELYLKVTVLKALILSYTDSSVTEIADTRQACLILIDLGAISTGHNFLFDKMCPFPEVVRLVQHYY